MIRPVRDRRFLRIELQKESLATERGREPLLSNRALTQLNGNLGLSYERGTGVPRDYTAAARWFRKAAEQNLMPAQRDLGVLYFTGTGVPKDEVVAYK